MADDTTLRSAALADIEVLDEVASRAILARNRLCTISLVDGDTPYAVPLFYGFDGDSLYLGVAEGRKTSVLDRNPNVCVTVVETGPGSAWASVQLSGRGEWLHGADRDAAVVVLMEHNRRVRDAMELPAAPESRGAGTGRRHGGGRILRLASGAMTGRARR